MGARERKARHARRVAADERKIGRVPAVGSWPRRRRAEASVEAWCRTYVPNWFPLALSPSHREAAALLQTCTDEGGLAALAMPRGTGKTTWTLGAVLRAVLSGRRKFVVIVCATDQLAEKAIQRLKTELETNDRIHADYGEATTPIRALERITRRALGQVWDDGTPTRIEWNAGAMRLPYARRKAGRGGRLTTTPSSGATIVAVGITGAIRGMSVAGPDGEVIRPDMVVLDDVQTRESAKSPTQTSDRESIVSDDVLGLAGPTTSIAAAMLCTPIYDNDLAERFLDPTRHPEWQGRRTKMLAAMPADMDLWDRYKELRQDGQRAGDRGAAATEFYRENRSAMDAGAVVTWPERMKAGELSGLQSAMNLWCDNPRGFRAEYQCEPERIDLIGSAKELVAAAVAGRTSGLGRGVVPRECSRLTAFVDCGGLVHWFAVVAWSEKFGGSVVDYGPWPSQARPIFAAVDARPTLSDSYPGRTESQLVYAGLADLTEAVLGRPYKREDGGEDATVDRCLVDCGWQPAAVYQFVRASKFARILYPSKGIGRTATARGVSEWKPRPGEQKGWHWRLTVGETGKGRMVQFDPDAWKTFVWERLSEPMGGPSGLTLFGGEDEKRVGRHEMIGEHCAAEYATPITLRGATFDKWAVKPHRPDNHLWDCLVGAAVAAGVTGLQWSPGGADVAPKKPRKKVDISDLYAKAQQGAA